MNTFSDLSDPISEPTSPPKNLRRLTSTEWEQFQRDGFVVFRQLVPAAPREQMLAVTLNDVQRGIAPVEFEAELQYPGAPASLASEGGRTIRRLKQALTRHYCFTQVVCD